jgi:hypothetical protein
MCNFSPLSGAPASTRPLQLFGRMRADGMLLRDIEFWGHAIQEENLYVANGSVTGEVQQVASSPSLRSLLSETANEATGLNWARATVERNVNATERLDCGERTSRLTVLTRKAPEKQVAFRGIYW